MSNAIFHSLLSTDSNGLFVSSSGTGDGLTSATPMSISDFLAEPISLGTTIYFNRGDTFILGEKDLTVSARIKPYGAGADPILRGSQDISGLTWTDTGGGIYTAPMAAEPSWVWIAGVCAKNAETARIAVTARGSTTTATVANGTLDVYTSIVGAYLVIKEKNFQNSQRVTITNFDKPTDVITFDGPIPTGSNIDLVVYNDIEFLSGNNEWVWSSGTLYVKATASPSTLDIRSSLYDYGVKTTGSLVIDNIEFKEYYTAAIWSDGGVVNITDSSFHDIRDAAVLIQRGVTNPSVTNSTFTRIGNNGITTRPSTNFVISGNTFTDIGMQANYNWQTWFDGDGLIAINNVESGGCAVAYVVDLDDATYDGSGLIFSTNTVTNTAYCGILLGLGTTPLIENNLISDFMNRYDDGGAIYTFHYRPQNVPLEDAEIRYNIVHNGNGKAAGVGIYLDNRTLSAYVHHNTIYDCVWGILFNYDTSDHTCEYNNLRDCTDAVVYRQYDLPGFLYTDNINNQFNFNNIGLRTGAQRALFFDLNYSEPTWNPYSGTGGADNNVYLKNVAPSFIANIENHAGDASLSGLQTAYGEDASSTFLTYITALVVNPTAAISNEDAQSDYKDFAGSTLTTYTIDPYYSRIIGEVDYSNFLVASSSQYYNAGTTADVQFTNASAYSIGFWFKFAANPGGTQTVITNQNLATSRGIGVFIRADGTFIVNIISTTGTSRLQLTTAVDVADNAWHHFLLSYTGTPANTKIYINGVSAETIAANNLTTTTASTDPWLIGAFTGPSLYLDAYLDEVAIWPNNQNANALTIYNSGRATNYQDLAITAPSHYWRMGKTASLLDIGSSATDLNLTGVNSPASSTDVP